jgi:hypothetical protein
MVYKNGKVEMTNLNSDYSIDNFIGVFDGCFSKDICEFLVNYFEKCVKAGVTSSRQEYHKGHPKHFIDDESFTFHNQSFNVLPELRFKSSEFENVFWENCYKLYVEKYSIINTFDPHKVYTTKIQRTEIGQGYHVWHNDDGARANNSRILAFVMYLNDVEEGGETEFLYLSKRIKPKAGRLLLFPTGFTHTHRGNPPISNTKYIFTGWVEL